MKKILTYSLFYLISTIIVYGQTNQVIEKNISDFLSTDWPTVFSAKERLENTGNSCIPFIIDLMKDCKTHKLGNTDDLIYPGAEKYFGHGQIIDYDIDDICVRAGWLLEELTFINFGFGGIHLPDKELIGFIKLTFPDYYNSTDGQRQLGELTTSGKRKLIRSLSIEQARNWWITSSMRWNRLDALETSLKSSDEKQQVKALFYIRNGKTFCDGLDKNFYKNKLKDTIEKLSKSSTSRVSENAKLIMLDENFEWLLIKKSK